ncbi:unnamed protein product [Leptidea sinapis]|uniref:Non-homologous end-joining factor 1 n=1 Tax=Leptidea sinapis TaxID=189913 RepID=A0A5E4QJ17_9NEOP|nr:unnamed protein product [Leptidea sinapis]
MWKKLYNKNSISFFLKFEREADYFIYVTDYHQLWFLELHEQDLISLLQNCNLLLEVCTDELLRNGVNMLADPINLKNIDIVEEENLLKVSMTKSYPYPLKLVMKLTHGPNEMFFQHVTQPLLMTIQDLKRSESELRDLLICKDKEIEEYKMEAGEVCLPHMECHTMYNINFGLTNVETSLLEKRINVKNVVVKQEFDQNHPKVKLETETQDKPLDQEVRNIKTEIKSDLTSIMNPMKKKIKLNI